MNPTKPKFTDRVTHVPAEWANSVTTLLYDVFGLASTAAKAREALGIGSLSTQDYDQVELTGGSINDVTIGVIKPAQGKFSVLSVRNDPIDPSHVVNKRYFDDRLNDYSTNFLTTSGGTLQGQLTLVGDPVGPLDAIPKRYLVNTLTTNLVDKPIQRHRWTAGAGQHEFLWEEWVRPTSPYADNFVVFKAGRFLQHGLDYSVLLSSTPKITLIDAAVQGQIIDVMYLNNLNNLLATQTSPPDELFTAIPAWADPVNLRIGYAVGNYGQNDIASSSTMLRNMFVSAVVLVGALEDKQISWIGSWFPGSVAAQSHPPTITAVSATEAQIRLPENAANNEFFWEGRYEVTMYVDGVQVGTRLWCDLSNQEVPNLRDGLVRWGVTDGLMPVMLTTSVEANCKVTAALSIDGGARTTFQRSVANGIMALTFTNTGTEPQTVVPPQTVAGIDIPYGWSEAFPVVAAGSTKTISAAYHVSATANQNVVFNFAGCPAPITASLTA